MAMNAAALLAVLVFSFRRKRLAADPHASAPLIAAILDL